MSSVFPEARIDPPASTERPACPCDRREIAITVEKVADEMAGGKLADWKGRKGHSITDDLADLLDLYYDFSGACPECKEDGR